MTTGRINQVTVLHARPRGPHGAAGTGRRSGAPAPRPGLVTDRSKSFLPTSGRRGPRAVAPAGTAVAVRRVPSPPISHASVAFPRSDGPSSAPSVETTVERPPPLRREGLPERGGSPICWLRSELAQKGDRVHIPLHGSRERSKALRNHLHSGKSESRSQTARPQNPFPSGLILQGRRINRSAPGRPAVPKKIKRKRRSGGVYAFTAVPAPFLPSK